MSGTGQPPLVKAFRDLAAFRSIRSREETLVELRGLRDGLCREKEFPPSGAILHPRNRDLCPGDLPAGERFGSGGPLQRFNSRNLFGQRQRNPVQDLLQADGRFGSKVIAGVLRQLARIETGDNPVRQWNQLRVGAMKEPLLLNGLVELIA